MLENSLAAEMAQRTASDSACSTALGSALVTGRATAPDSVCSKVVYLARASGPATVLGSARLTAPGLDPKTGPAMALGSDGDSERETALAKEAVWERVSAQASVPQSVLPLVSAKAQG